MERNLIFLGISLVGRTFKIMMTSIPGVNVLSSSSGNLSFRGANNSFKNLLTVGTRGWWKNEYIWTGNYELTKQTYEKAYFPFWNFKEYSKKLVE